MEGILVALAALTPLNVLMAILGGIIFGLAFRDYWLHAGTIYLCIVFVAMFSIGRLVFVGVAGASGAGLLGTILFLIYLVTTIIVRHFFGRKRPY